MVALNLPTLREALHNSSCFSAKFKMRKDDRVDDHLFSLYHPQTKEDNRKALFHLHSASDFN